MPLVLPPFTIYQAPTFPVRGNWNVAPPEGDQYINFEIDWSLQGGASHNVQVNVAGGGYIPISQIAALSIDNTDSDADVSFVFPDSGYTLTVPAKASLITPVFTNSLTFYVVSPSAAAPDVVRFGVLNSVPPPVAALPTSEQSLVSVGTIALDATGVTQLVPAGSSGEIEAFQMTLSGAAGVGGGVAAVQLQDGSLPSPVVLWSGAIAVPASTVDTISVSLSGIRARFFDGVAFVVVSTTLTGGNAAINLYYGAP